MAKTINNKQCFILSKSSVLGQKWLYTLGIRPFSTGTPPSDSNPIYKFQLHPRPPYSPDIFLTGRQAVNYDIVMPELAHLYFYGSRQVRLRLAFRVIQMPALHQEISDERKRRLFLWDYIENIDQDLPFHKEGIEFIFGPEVVKVLVQMIKDALVIQGKEPEKVYIQICYWPLKNDVGHNGDDYEDYYDD